MEQTNTQKACYDSRLSANLICPTIKSLLQNGLNACAAFNNCLFLPSGKKKKTTKYPNKWFSHPNSSVITNTVFWGGLHHVIKIILGILGLQSSLLDIYYSMEHDNTVESTSSPTDSQTEDSNVAFNHPVMSTASPGIAPALTEHQCLSISADSPGGLWKRREVHRRPLPESSGQRGNVG